MSALLPLRPFQREAIDAVWASEVQRPAIVLPTGTGKTTSFAHLAKERLERMPGTKVLVLVHTDELVQQAQRTIRNVAPHLNVGVVKAAQDEVTADVIVGSVQTLRNLARRERIRGVSMVVVDEAHHATSPSYRSIISHYNCLTVGFTATMGRSDGQPLGEIWKEVVYTRSIGWMIRKRFLIDVIGKRVQVPELDLASVKRSGGDFQDTALADALIEGLAPEAVAKAYADHALDRSGILFAPTVASAQVFAEALVAQGISAEVVHGLLPKHERTAILWRLNSGETQVVANCMVLTEGFDCPRVSCVVVARPTQSAPLYVQMVGRGLRVDPARPYEEQDCLILDVVGASNRNSLRSIVTLSDRPLEVKEGRKLTELEDEFDAGPGLLEEDESHLYGGPVQVSEFDPLAARSTKAWNRTTGGTYFLPAGDRGYVFLIPGYEVAWCTKGSKDRLNGSPGGLTEHKDLDLEMAMAWAEDLAVDMGADPYQSYTKKAAPWRRKKPSDAMIRKAQGLGIKVSEGSRAGELSDRINKVLATARIEPIVRVLSGKQ